MNLEEKVFSLAEGPVADKGLTLVEVELKKLGSRQVLTLFIEKAGGVGVEDCANVSRMVDVLLEAEGLISGPYTLEVSSPGLTRALKSARDFGQKIGESIKVKFVGEDKKIISTIGKLESVNEESLILLAQNGPLGIKLDSIKSAKMEVNI